MKLTPTPIDGAMILEPHVLGDERGYFMRAFCADTLNQAGVEHQFVQANMSGCAVAGTLRGLHYQDETAPEAKLLRCIAGSVYDVLVDLRPGSKTFGRWFGVELSAQNKRAMLIPPLCAHGYLALEDGAEVHYMVSEYYTPAAEKGVRFDDPGIGIVWPIPVRVVSEKDQNWPDLELPGSQT